MKIFHAREKKKIKQKILGLKKDLEWGFGSDRQKERQRQADKYINRETETHKTETNEEQHKQSFN